MKPDISGLHRKTLAKEAGQKQLQHEFEEALTVGAFISEQRKENRIRTMAVLSALLSSDELQDYERLGFAGMYLWLDEGNMALSKKTISVGYGGLPSLEATLRRATVLPHAGERSTS